MKNQIIFLCLLISIVASKPCLDIYSCFNTETQCKPQTDECMKDQGCLQVLTSPDSCLFDCTKDCLKNPQMDFPYTCFQSCIPLKQNEKYSALMNCKLSACPSSTAFLENSIQLLGDAGDDCAGIRGVWKGTITYSSFTDHWIVGCTGQTTMTITGSDGKFFYTLDVKCPGTINGSVGPYCNSYCNEGQVKKIGSCSGGNVNINYFSGARIGDTMVLVSQEGTNLEARITLNK